ncbi:unnamed protein product [Tuber melanosporum]|uniref:(Perigord truffle) hypothetical protein n=1 Tax=Tuber melanosporum (strain Mel28) TaxID=656061 RepID=D5GFZ6_TUBMM|nr:uncharacterized protein GSTUM_00001959001 [Tuber melanosporum]CAZ83439.1 unnamed protein product [Tuber melanosporum]
MLCKKYLTIRIILRDLFPIVVLETESGKADAIICIADICPQGGELLHTSCSAITTDKPKGAYFNPRASNDIAYVNGSTPLSNTHCRRPADKI